MEDMAKPNTNKTIECVQWVPASSQDDLVAIAKRLVNASGQCREAKQLYAEALALKEREQALKLAEAFRVSASFLRETEARKFAEME